MVPHRSERERGRERERERDGMEGKRRGGERRLGWAA